MVGCLVLAEILIRSLMAIASWTSIKHLMVWRLTGWFSVPGWYHAGSSSFRRGGEFYCGEGEVVFLACFYRSFYVFVCITVAPRVQGFHVYMKGLVLAQWSVPFGAAAFDCFVPRCGIEEVEASFVYWVVERV
jgi:hypothetical protein